AFLSTKLPGTIAGESDPELDTWLERSLRLASYPYNARHPETNLVPHIPFSSNHAGREDQFMAFTTMHLLAQSLLKSYEHTGEQQFLDQAITYLTAYDQYGYDADAKTYWGALHLDGTPDTSPRSGPRSEERRVGKAGRPRGVLHRCTKGGSKDGHEDEIV